MASKNIIFIARSLDGFIAGKNGELDWLESIPNPENVEMGFSDLMQEIDAIVMGRTTYETVLGFGIDWPYEKHVFVLSSTLKEIPENLIGKITILNGELSSILEQIRSQGFKVLYIDGGRTIQNFLKEDLIDELIISTIPILLGGGFPLFGKIDKPLNFDHVSSKVFLKQIVQDKYRRRK
ncbi:dihydrofolate reductase family protein [Muricauda sp. 2012CJ35-5]|uniref:Dihydrofolate reductase family protein n=1 Tax=Flagellimonas spongiicola TaxID=2942208 RepID=A0ABT0PUA1_9FLAO|nr:dihydrofolate reductase family protein [Allomuricauda spongiicola]MCL6274929.1 dihydrofolate reductase family protein [Allomuricauda spongiicola]